MTPELMFPLIMSWGVGPSPSAHEVDTGVAVAVEGTAAVGVRAAGGAGASVAVTPHPRVRTELSVQGGTSWALCTDCGAKAANLEARATVIRHRAFNLAPWVLGTGTLASGTIGTTELTAGLAVEGGWRRVRLDASWPLQSTQYLLTTLRVMPEHGAAVAWTDRQATRIAVVGLEPAVAVQHRWRLGSSTFESGVRYGEEGLGVQLGLNHRF